MRIAIMAALSAGLFWSSLMPAAQAASFQSEYTITAFGLRLASTAFQTRLNGDTYSVQGTLRTAGLVRLFSTTDGTVRATGAINGETVTPSGFEVRYTEDGEPHHTTIDFNGNRIADVFNKPPLKKGDTWIDVPAAELADALDPIAAALVPASSPRQVCGRTLRIFDGAMRADLAMRYLRTVPFSATGFKGDVVTCNAQFTPVAGYRADKEDVLVMRDESRIEISFAPVGETGLFAPVKGRITVGGNTVNITATRFEQLTN